MLGCEVARMLATVPGVEVLRSSRALRRGWVELDAEGGAAAARSALGSVEPDLVVNCAGVLASELSPAGATELRRAVAVNALFPHDLGLAAEARGVRVVHVSTDAVFRAAAGRCFEDDEGYATDVYAATKRLGEPLLGNVVSLRCSFVGRLPDRRGGLLEWIAQHPPGAEVQGFVDQAWNGLTTAHVARVCAALAEPSFFERARAEGHVHHLFHDPPLTKHELLVLIAEAFGLELTVTPVSSGRATSRVLGTRYSVLREHLESGPSLVASLEELARRDPIRTRTYD